MPFSSSALIRICLLALIGPSFPGCVSAQTASAASPSQQKARAAYDTLLERIQQGDMSVDFQAFRIDGAIVAGPHISAVEVADRATFKKFMSESNPQGALEFSNRTLSLDYASAVAHFDAMMACQALNQAGEAVRHEKLLNALLDSMAKDGDGKTPDTSYIAATTQEEYIFIARRLNLRPKGQQSLVVQAGHFYDLLKVIDPKTNSTQDLWFNVDVQMNPDGRTVETPVGSSTNSAAPGVVTTAQRIAPAQSKPNGAEKQFGEGKDVPLKKDAADDRLRSIEIHSQTSPAEVLYDQQGVLIVATETPDAIELAVTEPDFILVSVEVDRNQNGQYDRLVDVAYRPQSNGNLCPQFLIDSQHNTACGGFTSHAYLKDFKDDMGCRQFVLVLPKKEVSFDQPSVRLAFVFRDTALSKTSFYPIQRLRNSIDVPYTIKQADAASPVKALNYGTVPVAIGQSISEVVSNFGTPISVMNSDAKTIYLYKSMKITFIEGKVREWKTDSIGEASLGQHSQSMGKNAGVIPGEGSGVGIGFDSTGSNSVGLYIVGGNVSQPIAISQPEAEYTNQASRAKYQGVCLISLIVDANGRPQNPRVIRPLGMGLDEMALRAVRKYKFKPAMKNGITPVPVMITIEVNFRLYSLAR